MYGGYVSTLSKRFLASLLTIEAVYNFEFGQEFEIAICNALADTLPDNYGIARGFAVAADDKKAGDDILIFERSRFPTLAARNRHEYLRKEQVAIEGIYCYIEAKHTINLEGDDPQSMSRALSQVAAVKTLCAQRKPLKLTDIAPNVSLSSKFEVKSPNGYPNYRNPMFGAIFARQVRDKKGGQLIERPDEIEQALKDLHLPDFGVQSADLVVLGESTIWVPVVVNGVKKPTLSSPFYDPEFSQMWCRKVDRTAFAAGFCSIMCALGWIELGTMPWQEILRDALGV